MESEVTKQQLTKQQLRKRMMQSIKASPAPDEDSVRQRICTSREYNDCKAVFAYVPLKSEVDITGVVNRAMEDGKQVFLPCEDPGIVALFPEDWKDHLRRCGNNTMVLDNSCPISIVEKDFIYNDVLVLVPGLAFTDDGARLGRGAGFYDKLLNELKADFTSVGICRKTQILEYIPQQPHDKNVDMVFAF